MHGCFWHAHGCKGAHVPKSNVDYWKPKLERNQARDGENVAALAVIGWESLIVWECETADAHSLKKPSTGIPWREVPMSDSPSPEAIVAALKKSGYLMEQEVATQLENLGFNVWTNWAFEDSDEGKSREMDIRAIKRVAHNEEKTSLSVCRNSS